MTEASAARPERPDGINLKSPDAPGKLFNLLVENAKKAGEVDAPTFIDDLSDLASTGIFDRVPVLEAKALAWGQNPNFSSKLWEEIERRQDIESARLLGFDWEELAKAEDTKTPEKRAEEIGKAIEYAEFASSDEFLVVMDREGENQSFMLSSYDHSYKHPRIKTATDLVSMPRVRNNDRPSSLVLGALKAYDPEMESVNFLEQTDVGNLVTIMGEKNGKFVIEGGGFLHTDSEGNQVLSAFKIDFSSEEQLSDFAAWLKESPTNALHSTIGELLKHTYMPPRKTVKGPGLAGVFINNSNIRNAYIKYLDLSQPEIPQT